jgi:hypothetical protein
VLTHTNHAAHIAGSQDSGIILRSPVSGCPARVLVASNHIGMSPVLLADGNKGPRTSSTFPLFFLFRPTFFSLLALFGSAGRE